jgi:signal transduction histidine kinase/ligand-binding sensor domain-containing protein
MISSRRRDLLGTARVVASWCVLLACLSVASPAIAGSRLLDEYVLTSWTDEDGLFGGWIVGIAQDRHGYLWIGTVSGILRFDGLRFERFRDTDGTDLPQRSVSAVYAARDGSVWVGFSGEGGVCRIRDGQIKTYGASDGLGIGRVTALAEDDGAVLAATPVGLYRLADDRWQRIDATQGMPDEQVYTLYRDRQDALWAATSKALFRRETSRAAFHQVSDLSEAPTDLSESRRGSIWMTDSVLGYRMLDQASRRPQTRAASQLGYGFRLLHDRADNLWVATLGQGLWFLRDGDTTPELVVSSNGLSADTVRCLFEDRNGDVWVGTTSGLHRFARRRVTPITDLGVVRAVEAGPQDNVWIATADGLVRFSHGARRWYRLKDGLPSLDIKALHIDTSGALWVSTTAGVAVLTGERFSPLRLEGRAWPADISSLAADQQGNVWLLSPDQGFFRWRDGRLAPVPLPATIDRLDVHSVAGDRSGRIWATLSSGGLAMIHRDGTFELLRSGDRVHRSDLAVYEDNNGAVWFGAGERLTRFKDGVLSSITRSNGLPAETIRAIASDTDGYLWIGTSGGIFRLAESEFDRATKESVGHLEFRSYNSSDGLAGVPIRVGAPSAARSSDGQLWFVSGNGVTVVDPRRLSATRPSPNVRIQRVTANGRSFEPTGSFDLPPRTTSLEVEYTALEFFSPRQVEFHYRLEGLDDTWTEAFARRQASFTNLAPRRYRFQVIARSSEGIWNDEGAAIEFSIQPMFYQTSWFYALCTVAVLGLVFAGWRLRLREVRRQFGLVLTERARMAREIHDTLLQSLAGLELQVDAMSSQLDTSQGAVRQQLERVRRQIQSDVSEARQSIWDLRSPSLETRDLVSALEELGDTLAGPSGVGFEFTVSGSPSRCARKVEEHLLRVGREAVSNAVRHAHASLVRLELVYGADSITLRVSDDGRGFDVGEAVRQTENHWGLATMHERAQAIGGQLSLVSRPGAGTNLEMIAPLLSPSHP